MSEIMTFPKTFDEFAEQYKIVDEKQVYTNGTELIPIFRVKQWLENTDNLINRQKAEIEKLQELVNEMGDYFPACIGCEGKTPLGERTDKCVYMIDNTNYCTKRGIANILSIKNENRELKAEIERLKTENKLLIENDISNKYPNCVLVEKGRIYTRTLEDYDELIGDISAEAYKEFAERIKIRFAGTLQCSSWVIQKAVDNILKELVGEESE